MGPDLASAVKEGATKKAVTEGNRLLRRMPGYLLLACPASVSSLKSDVHGREAFLLLGSLLTHSSFLCAVLDLASLPGEAVCCDALEEEGGILCAVHTALAPLESNRPRWEQHTLRLEGLDFPRMVFPPSSSLPLGCCLPLSAGCWLAFSFPGLARVRLPLATVLRTCGGGW